jgi:hypothetical protein
MPRRSRRRMSFRVRTVHYSSETQNLSQVVTFSPSSVLHTFSVPLIPPAVLQGIRKAKNFTVRLAFPDATISLQWALVFAPEGPAPSSYVLRAGTAGQPLSLYEPNQNVILCGLWSPGMGVVNAHSRLARNLQSGDSCVLLVSNCWPTGDATIAIHMIASLNYAITY